MTEDETVGWHHRLSGHEFEQIPGGSEGPGSLECCISWGCKESDMTWWLNNSNKGIPLMKVSNTWRAILHQVCAVIHLP